MGVAKAGNGGSGVERLTDAQVRNAKPDPDKAIRKLSDGRGLYLAVMPTGSKLWRMKYRIGGKEKTYSIGAYPEVSLADARDECTAARDWLRNGKDPVTARKVHRATALSEQQTIFAALSAEWLPLQPFSPGHRKHQQALLDNDLLPYLGKLPVAEISPAIALEVLRKVERRGALETAAKCRRLMSQIFRFAVQTSRATGDPAALLSGAIRTPDTKHRATVPGKDMPALFKAMAAVPAELNTKLAFYWLVLTAARTVEMRFATWGEIDGNLWRVPAARMKMRREHVVPLSIQAQQVLVRARALRTARDDDALLFPGFTRHGALSENALLALLARAGFYGRQTAHGFRAAFSTWAHEVREADPDVTEACLAHVSGSVRMIYNRATYLSKRATLLQAWADRVTAWGMRLP